MRIPAGGEDAALHKGARRHSHRWAFDADVELRAPIRGTGMTLNASSGGLRVVMDTVVSIGEICAICVRTLDGRESTEQVRVVWSQARPDGYVMGLQFVEAPEA